MTSVCADIKENSRGFLTEESPGDGVEAEMFIDDNDPIKRYSFN